MAYRRFDSNNIRKSENPFPNTRAASICNGTFIREVCGKYNLDADAQTAVEYGLLKKLLEHYNNSKGQDGKYKPSHLLILADYGQGKTLALRYLQDKIYTSSYDVIVSKSVSNDAQTLLDNENTFIHHVLSSLKDAYIELIHKHFTSQVNLLDNIAEEDEAQNQFLFYDKAFSDLNTRVFIFLDELDKIFEVEALSGLESKQKSFLEELKIIADCCKKSISLWVAGTPQCLGTINNFGRDYKERFDTTIRSTFNEKDTINYINKKCVQKLQYVGYIPLTNEVKKEIFKYSYGKIRYINLFCKELWNIAADEKIKIDMSHWKTYIKSKFEEPIKEVFGNAITYSQIELLSKLISKDKVSCYEIYINKNNRTKQEIQGFINSNLGNENLIKINKSYKLNTNLKNQIISNLFGE